MRRFWIVTAVIVALFPFGSSYAITQDDLNAIINDTNFYDPSAASSGSCNFGDLTADLPSIIPQPFNGIFSSAGKKFNVSPALVTAIFGEEHGFDPSTGKDWPNPNGPWATSSAGAEGPFQFEPPTWAGEGEDGNGDGVKDIQNLADAAYGAAKYLASNGGTVDKPEGTSQGAPSLYNAIWHYNHADWYVQQVLKYYHEVLSLSGATTSSGQTAAPVTTSDAACGGAGISTDGFVFPQLTTKAQLAAQKPEAWNPNCTNKVSEMGPGSSNPVMQMDGLCHHDYLAADIFNDTGVAVVSPRPGRVVSYHDGGSVGWTIRIYSDKALGGDGLWYYLAHMLKPGEGGKLWVQVGDVIKAGQQVGQVGTNADAENTQHHTHIDVSPQDNSFARGYDGTHGPLLDPQPALKAAYERLPDK